MENRSVDVAGCRLVDEVDDGGSVAIDRDEHRATSSDESWTRSDMFSTVVGSDDRGSNRAVNGGQVAELWNLECWLAVGYRQLLAACSYYY